MKKILTRGGVELIAVVLGITLSLLVDDKKKIRKKWLSSFARDIKKLKSQNKKIVIVSSGAIALGCKKMNYNKMLLKLDKSQAIASIGQIELINLFSETFTRFKLNICSSCTLFSYNSIYSWKDSVNS